MRFLLLLLRLRIFGVFLEDVSPQSSQLMLDFILAVDCPRAWHAKNMAINPEHYSVPLRWLGPRAASVVQTSFGAGVYFNTLLAAPRSFKYGVIAVADLERDLQGWESLYVAGRMHKPIRVVSRSPLPGRLLRAAESNLSAATSAALLTLPARFSETDLYQAAAGLSYAGDIRMAVRAEVGGKVRNIVRANLGRFRGLYHSALADANVCRGREGVWERGLDPLEQRVLLQRLPVKVLAGVCDALGVIRGHRDSVKEVSHKDATLVRSAVLSTVSTIVMRSSIRQAVKGLATAGVGTSIRYAAAKFSKAFAARRSKTYSAAAFRRRGSEKGRQ